MTTLEKVFTFVSSWAITLMGVAVYALIFMLIFNATVSDLFFGRVTFLQSFGLLCLADIIRR